MVTVNFSNMAGGRQDFAEGHQSEVELCCDDMVSRLYSTVLYNISMHILNILSEEVNYEERFRLVLKNYTLLRSFYNLCIIQFFIGKYDCRTEVPVFCLSTGFCFQLEPSHPLTTQHLTSLRIAEKPHSRLLSLTSRSILKPSLD